MPIPKPRWVRIPHAILSANVLASYAARSTLGPTHCIGVFDQQLPGAKQDANNSLDEWRNDGMPDLRRKRNTHHLIIAPTFARSIGVQSAKIVAADFDQARVVGAIEAAAFAVWQEHARYLMRVFLCVQQFPVHHLREVADTCVGRMRCAE